MTNFGCLKLDRVPGFPVCWRAVPASALITASSAGKPQTASPASASKHSSEGLESLLATALPTNRRSFDHVSVFEPGARRIRAMSRPPS